MKVQIRVLHLAVLLLAIQGLAFSQKQEKLFYDKEWKGVPTSVGAAFYRVFESDAAGNPVGVVKDYYITGELQWEGRFLKLGRNDSRPRV